MAALDGYIYAIGGYDGNSRLSTVERYCPKTNRWMFVAPLSQPTSKLFAVGLNGFLYAAGSDIKMLMLVEKRGKTYVQLLQNHSHFVVF